MSLRFVVPRRNLSSCLTRLQKKSKYSPSFMLQESSNPFLSQQSGPPKLPDDEQAEFERLQKLANSQAAIEEYNESVSAEPPTDPKAPILKKTDIGTFSPQYFKTIPEFEGDINPKTGEVGGPKQEPLKHGDWSFNGRVTDF